MKRMRPLRAMIPLALTLAAVVSPVHPAVPQHIELAANEDAPGPEEPERRAAALNLPKPLRGPVPAQEACAMDVTGRAPLACFPALPDVDDFIAGNARPEPGGTQIVLTGSGGQPAAVTQQNWYSLGRTCRYKDCTGSSTTYWAVSNANCTHSYPANDYYRNGVAQYVVYYPRRDYDNNFAGQFNNNCGTVAIYRDSFQGGAGAKLCALRVTSNPADAECQQNNYSVLHQSISWHYGLG